MSSRTTLPSGDFNQDPTGAKKAADKGPVFISKHGKSQYVLLNIRDYNRLLGSGEDSIVDLLGMEEAGNIEFNPEKRDHLFKPENFS